MSCPPDVALSPLRIVSNSSSPLPSLVFRTLSPLVLLGPSSILLLPCLCGGGGGAIDARLLLDISILITLAGLPDMLRELFLAGGVGGGRDTAEGDVNTFGCEEFLILAGRLLGGGGGAFALFDLGRPRSTLAMLGSGLVSSSTFGDSRPVLRTIRESDTN